MYASAYVWAKVLMHMEERLGAVTVSSWFAIREGGRTVGSGVIAKVIE